MSQFGKASVQLLLGRHTAVPHLGFTGCTRIFVRLLSGQQQRTQQQLQASSISSRTVAKGRRWSRAEELGEEGMPTLPPKDLTPAPQSGVVVTKTRVADRVLSVSCSTARA